MPIKPETTFYRRINANIPFAIHRQRVTSVSTNGTPDFWYSGMRDGWVEYKWEAKLSRNGVDPLKLLRPLQLRWINSRYREGRLVLVVVGSPQGCAILEHEAWNKHVLHSAFRYAASEVSVVLTEKFNVPSESVEQGRISDESGLSNPHDFSFNRGDSL